MAIKTPAELLQDISTYITNKVGKIRRSEHGAVERDIVESLDSLITTEKNARENADSLILNNVGEALTELEEDLVGLIGGKVSGPASSINNSIPGFDGVTGKLLKNGTGVYAVGGQVGIGTNNPSEKLHVIGNVLASGDSASATKTIGGKVRMEYDPATDTLEFNFI